MSRSGFTIIELLVVIAIISLLAGLSAGAFLTARRNHRLAAAAGELQGLLRAARNTSVSSGTPSFVVVDPSTRRVWAQSFETAGEWSFESVGGDGEVRDFVMSGGSVVEGRLGSGVNFEGEGGHVDCGVRPAYDLRAGVVIEAWVRHHMEHRVKPPRSDRSRKRPRLTGKRRSVVDEERSFTILEKKGSYSLELTEEGALVGSIGDHVVITEDDVVAPGRWVFVSLRYDGRALDLVADGVERSTWALRSAERLVGRRRHELPEEIPVTASPVTISSPQTSFRGDIDEVRLRGRMDTLVYEIPDFYRIIGWKKIVHFDRRGHLDAAFHESTVRIVLAELGDDKFESVDEAAGKKARRRRSEGTADFSLTYEEWLDTEAGEEMLDIDQRTAERRIEDGSLGSAKKLSIEIDRLGVIQ